MAKTILIVEDNDNNRILLRDIVIYHGYKAIEAENGTEGVSIAKKIRPDLILMDIQMPGKDGFEAIAELRGDPETASIAVIALTSFAMKGDRERILAAGFDYYLAKPIDTRKLPQVIEKFLGAKTKMQESSNIQFEL